jgi:hypothetical protein
MKIDICNLKAPAKCARCQNQHGVPFAISTECKQCEYKTEANIVTTGDAVPVVR